MQNRDVQIKCFKCGTSYLMDMMRMDPAGKNLICRYCLERRPAPKSASAPISAPSLSADREKPSSSKISYVCGACKYTFNRASTIKVSACPYCGSGSVQSKGPSNKMVWEVDSLAEGGDY